MKILLVTSNVLNSYTNGGSIASRIICNTLKSMHDIEIALPNNAGKSIRPSNLTRIKNLLSGRLSTYSTFQPNLASHEYDLVINDGVFPILSFDKHLASHPNIATIWHNIESSFIKYRHLSVPKRFVMEQMINKAQNRSIEVSKKHFLFTDRDVNSLRILYPDNPASKLVIRLGKKELLDDLHKGKFAINEFNFLSEAERLCIAAVNVSCIFLGSANTGNEHSLHSIYDAFLSNRCHLGKILVIGQGWEANPLNTGHNDHPFIFLEVSLISLFFRRSINQLLFRIRTLVVSKSRLALFLAKCSNYYHY